MRQPVATHLDNFDFLRLVAAFFVFFSHSFSIYGYNEPQLLTPIPRSSEITFGTLGVTIFFVISGFLVTQSFIHTKTPIHFIAKRAARLYPALFLNFFIVSFILVPLSDMSHLAIYFENLFNTFPSRIADYIHLRNPHLHLVFLKSYVPNVVNAPMWTLEYEAMCYGIVILCGCLFDIRKTIPIATLLYFTFYSQKIYFPENIVTVHFASFLLGSCAFIYRDHIKFTKPLALICLLLMVLLDLDSIYFLPLYLVITTYLTLYVALSVRYLGNISKHGDFSYGIYIYAWPVQQLLISLFDWKNAWFPFFIVTSWIIILGFAALSWHAIERPALALKHKFLD